MPFSIVRTPRSPLPSGGGLRAGSVRIDITPALGHGLAGHGPASNSAQGALGRLFAMLMVLEDDDGTRVVLGTIDLHASSRYLSESLGAALADVGLSTDRILIAATHTHRGPASILGSKSYDRLSGPAWVTGHWEHHFDRPLADAMVARLEAGVRGILGPSSRTPDLVTLRPAELALSAPKLWGWSSNRSPAALASSLSGLNPENFLWTDPPANTFAEKQALSVLFNNANPPLWIGGSPTSPSFIPGDLTASPARTVPAPLPSGPVSTGPTDSLDNLLFSLLKKHDLRPLGKIAKLIGGSVRPQPTEPFDAALVDSRLHCLLAREPGGAPIGLFSVFGATPSLIGARHPIYTGDAYAHAATEARAALPIPFPLGIAGGGLGDVNLVPRGMPLAQVRESGKRLDDAIDLVRQVGGALSEALIDVIQRPLPGRSDIKISTSYKDFDPVAAGLDSLPMQGGTSLGGSELADSPFAAFFPEGLRSKTRYYGQQAPKARLPPLASGPMVWPLRRFDLYAGTDPWWTVVAAPPEISTALAADIRDYISDGNFPVTVTSPNGEFGGYAGTRWEYITQSYEGSATLFGQYTGPALMRSFRAELSEDQPLGSAAFTSGAGALPLRLGAKCLGAKPNAMSAPIRWKGCGLRTLRGHGRPHVRRKAVGSSLIIEASFFGERPDAPLWEQPVITVLTRTGGALRPHILPVSGLVANDQNLSFLVWADVRKKRVRWYVRAQVPGLASIPSEDVRLQIGAAIWGSGSGLLTMRS